jgi:hypothetical protein
MKIMHNPSKEEPQIKFTVLDGVALLICITVLFIFSLFLLNILGSNDFFAILVNSVVVLISTIVVIQLFTKLRADKSLLPRTRRYLPDILIIFGVFVITFVSKLNSTKSSYIAGRRTTDQYPAEDAFVIALAVSLVVIGIDIVIRRFFKRPK